MNIDQIAICYISMDLSRQALQTNGKLFFKFRIIGHKPKNIQRITSLSLYKQGGEAFVLISTRSSLFCCWWYLFDILLKRWWFPTVAQWHPRPCQWWGKRWHPRSGGCCARVLVCQGFPRESHFIMASILYWMFIKLKNYVGIKQNFFLLIFVLIFITQ